MSSSTSDLPSPPTDLRDRLAQLMMVRIGSNLPPVVVVDDDEERIGRLLDECPVGGLILFNGTKARTPATLERLQSRSKYPLLVGSDLERGAGQQLRGYTLFPHAAALGRSDLVATYVEVLAREAREAGVHIAFAPVADVNTNRQNPIISIRAFSEDPECAAALSASYVALAEDRGLLTTAKHFPGHGDTHQDSHDALPSVDKSLDELRACELLPFQAAIDSGCSLVMTAHVAFPQIDPSGLPATLSAVLLKDLLRGEMGFAGVVCSDSLLMAGVRDLFESEGEMALAALNAGVDLLLDIKDPVEVVNFLVERVADGKLTTERIDKAFERVWRLKTKALSSPPPELPRPRGDWVEGVSDERLAAIWAFSAAQAAIEIGGRAQELIPLDPTKPLVAVLVKPFATAIDPPEQPLAAALRERFADVTYIELGPAANDAQFAAARAAALAAPQLVVAMIVRPAAWHAFGLLAHQADFVRSLSAARPTIVASLGVSQALDDYPDAAVRICTYSDVAVSQQALAELLFGNPLAR
ncbi:MAG: glycoside hydrolase family 3 protein [Pirellulales bacterium]